MVEVSIKIKNMAQIRAAFNKAPALMTRNLNLAIRRTAITIEGRSKRNTPVLTGRLRASTYDRFSNLHGEIGTNTEYDSFVHEGTRFMRARPYLRQAVEQSGGDSDRFFRQAVQDTLDAVARET